MPLNARREEGRLDGFAQNHPAVTTEVCCLFAGA